MPDIDGPWDGPKWNQAEWHEFHAVLLPNGVIDHGDGLVGAVTGLTTAPLRSQVAGIRFANRGVARKLSGAVTLTHTSNTSGNPRIDRVVERVDTVAKTIAPVIIPGTPAASPSPPSILSDPTRFDLPLAQVRVESGASAFPSDGSKHTDERPLFPSYTRLPRGRLVPTVRLTADWEWGSPDPATNVPWIIGPGANQLQTQAVYVPAGRSIYVVVRVPWLGGTLVADNVWQFGLYDNATLLGSPHQQHVSNPVPANESGFMVAEPYSPAAGVHQWSIKMDRFSGSSGNKATIRRDAWLAVYDMGAI